MEIKSLSIFFPALNDAKILPDLLGKADKTAKQITKDFEIIVVNDGSTDNTVEVLENLKEKYINLKIVNHEKNLGYGGALISGFKHSTKDWIFYTDGDGQYDPTELLKLAAKATDDIDVINGHKLNRKDSIARKIIGNAYNILLHRIYKLPISDIDCDFRLIRKSALDKIELNFLSGVICLELILKLKRTGARFTETGVNHYKRKFGKSAFFKPANLLKALLDNANFYINFRKLN